MGYFGQKVAFFPCRILKRAILCRDSPLFLRVFGLVVGGRNLLVLFSVIVHKAGLQPTGDDVGTFALNAVLARDFFSVICLSSTYITITTFVDR